MGFSEAGSANCRRHPNHKQSPGVCSSCLREKLSKLSMSPPSNSNSNSNSFNSKKPCIVSHSSSLSATPPSASSTTRHRRNGSESYVSVGMVLNNGLKKSRSVSCAPLTSRSKLGAAAAAASTNNNNNNDVINDKLKTCAEVDNSNHLKKKNGFLKKLIHSTSKKTKGVLMHSKTMRERTHPLTTIATNKN